MRYFKILFFIIVFFTFFYLLFNLNYSLTIMSEILVNFFKTLFPYLLTFLIINNLLINTNLIYLIGYLLQFIFYPLFRINAKSSAIALISLLNGFPSSALYASIMLKEGKIEENSAKRIAHYLFLPSYIFLFFVTKNKLPNPYFYFLVLSLYLPPLMMLFITKKKPQEGYIKFREIKKELTSSFNNFNYISNLKYIFKLTSSTIINILGMISFYSILNIWIPSLFLKGLFEFSIPTLTILNSTCSLPIKTFIILVILSFSSFSSISQASIYLPEVKISFCDFIKNRFLMCCFSLSIYSLLSIIPLNNWF